MTTFRDGSQVKVYVIAHDEYMGVEADTYSFVGTYRELLYTLNGIDPDSVNEPIDDNSSRLIRDLSDGELEELFRSANGDGQPFYLIFDVEEGKRILNDSERTA